MVSPEFQISNNNVKFKDLTPYFSDPTFFGIFRLSDGRIKAVENRCPHKGGPLSEGIVSGETVICPMHGLKISLIDGSALPPDEGNVKTYEIRTEGEKVWIRI
ncbi:MAG TPA: Rieske 2Fe-2S domain-containing protein [Thermodesulfovibrionales bacterium]|nr:Rieske 2Fe-2S domain-containing protein [Thermodesulfovibrionales bacterium]